MSEQTEGQAFTDLPPEAQDALFADSSVPFSREGVVQMLKEVADQVEQDVHMYEGAPFSGDVVAAWMAKLSAAVQAVARAAQLEIEGRLQ
jgi:hypothetical protein